MGSLGDRANVPAEMCHKENGTHVALMTVLRVQGEAEEHSRGRPRGQASWMPRWLRTRHLTGESLVWDLALPASFKTWFITGRLDPYLTGGDGGLPLTKLRDADG